MCAVTSSAPSSAIGFSHVIGMSALCNYLPAVLRRDVIAPHDVFSESDRLHVIGIHASLNPTKMVNGQPVRDGADEVFV